jgi:hypothetical protein
MTPNSEVVRNVSLPPWSDVDPEQRPRAVQATLAAIRYSAQCRRPRLQ